MADSEDPLVQALPPATDYLTYLTLLEYQLTPARLPLLHKLLQDETLTTNIGWDLVQMLLPMLPQSQECLQDIARLGNPREVILRVSDALMQLQPEDDDDDVASDRDQEDAAPTGPLENQTKNVSVEEKESSDDDEKPLPRHILKFNSLLAMLGVLHSRIETKSPSRFIATSLQAVLEAYTLMPTNESTIALLEFFREVSPSKRPAPPPRAASETTVLRVSEASAPDPESESRSTTPINNEEPALVRKFLQFGLVELIKSYLLSFSGPMDPGMSWAIRLQEKLHPAKQLAGKASQTDVYMCSKSLRERDMIMAKITALSRDFGISDEQLLDIVMRPPEDQPAPLDFEEPPKNADAIPLERHGALLLLSARAAMAELFSSGQVTPIAVFPNLAQIFYNFIGGYNTPDEVAFGQPNALLDSLLTLTVFSMQRTIGEPSSQREFRKFTQSLTACTARQPYASVRQIPGTIVHSNPSPLARFKVIRNLLEQETLLTVKDSAISWLKNEITTAAAAAGSNPPSPSQETNIFLNPHYFSVLVPFLFDSSQLLLNVSSDIVASWIKFSQSLTPSVHAALNLYYIIASSEDLRTRLQLGKTLLFVRNRFLEPLKTLLHAFKADLSQNGGDGKIEAAVGEEMCMLGMARSVETISLALEQVEDTLSDAYGVSDAELQEPSADDITRVDRARKETEP